MRACESKDAIFFFLCFGERRVQRQNHQSVRRRSKPSPWPLSQRKRGETTAGSSSTPVSPSSLPCRPAASRTHAVDSFRASSSTASRVHFRPVLERRIERAASLRRQVQHIPNWIQLVNAAFFDIVGQPWMATVKMAQGAITVSRKNRNSGVLMSFAIFAAEIVFKSALAGAQQT